MQLKVLVVCFFPRDVKDGVHKKKGWSNSGKSLICFLCFRIANKYRQIQNFFVCLMISKKLVTLILLYNIYKVEKSDERSSLREVHTKQLYLVHLSLQI